MVRNSWSYYAFQVKHAVRRLFRQFSQPNILVIASLVAWCIVIYVLFRSISWRLHSDQYLIKNVLFTSGTVMDYDDDAFLLAIVDIYTGAYYSTLRLWSSSSKAIKHLIKEEDFVSEVRYLSFKDNTLLVDVVFHEPLMRVLYNSWYYAMYEKSLLKLPPTSTIAHTRPTIHLPLYLSWSSESIEWLLHEVNPSKMLEDYNALQSSSIAWSISYIPGAQRYVIRRPELQVYISAKKSIMEQLETLFLLKEHYAWFEGLEMIDIWSLKQPIVK